MLFTNNDDDCVGDVVGACVITVPCCKAGDIMPCREELATSVISGSAAVVVGE